MARSGGPADLISRNLRALHGALEHSVTVQTTKLQELMDDMVTRGALTRTEADQLLGQLLSSSKAYSQALLQVLDTITETATAPVRATAGRIAQAVTQAPKLMPGRRRTPAPPRAAEAARVPVAATEAPAASKRPRLTVVDPSAKAAGADGLPDLSTLTVAQVKARIAGLDASALRRLRDQEVAGKNRKGVLAEIARQLD
ncbi:MULTISPECIES: hypothetical protein [unclassified Nocardioides]|uniref:hypothetical protein n=1 Tax=unclassified Nocardioides TaxID=2615069 RepID=UPI000703B268|nr:MULTISPECIES: hypothetical protein [unclassified Nocardioides]KRC50318.1 hypothetical protein ASE19_17145 [Nocardioides sp. Root79]KRC75786.1 hypothetical protein ASE20_23165 [Nocardioides sp. Root240]